jgi:hypothetical protein
VTFITERVHMNTIKLTYLTENLETWKELHINITI